MWERNIDLLPLTRPQLGTWPTTQACALSGVVPVTFNVLRLALNPLSHTSQGSHAVFKENGLNISSFSFEF